MRSSNGLSIHNSAGGWFSAPSVSDSRAPPPRSDRARLGRSAPACSPSEQSAWRPPRFVPPWHLAAVVKKEGFGKFEHNRDPTPIDQQTVIRMNRDTLYSGAVFDLDAGPVTVMLPDAGKRFMSMQVIDVDQYTHAVVDGAGRH